MKQKRIIILILLALVVVGGYVLYRSRPVPARIQLKLSGTTGLKVAGTYVADGVSNTFNGTLPGEIVVFARTFDYTIYMQEPTGRLSGEIFVVGRKGLTGSSATQDDFRGVSGSYSHTLALASDHDDDDERGTGQRAASSRLEIGDTAGLETCATRI